jgi:hypothetical protein
MKPFFLSPHSILFSGNVPKDAHPLFQFLPPLSCVGRKHDEFLRYLFYPGCHRGGDDRTGGDDPLDVGDACSSPQKDRGVELLAKGVGDLDELLRFGGVGRFEHGHLGGKGVISVVLFVLGTVHLRVVGSHNDKAAAHSRVGRRKQRIGCNVQADMLHRCQCPHSGEAGT